MKLIILALLLSSCAHQKRPLDLTGYVHRIDKQMLPNGTWEAQLYTGVPCYDIVESDQLACINMYKYYMQKHADSLCPSQIGMIFDCGLPEDPGFNLGDPKPSVLECLIRCK